MPELSSTQGGLAQPGGRPLLVFDGDCGFCRFWVMRWREKTGDRVDFQPSQALGAQIPEVPPAAFETGVVLLEPPERPGAPHRVIFGADAVIRLLEGYGAGVGRATAWLARKVPGVMPVSRWLYGGVSNHRMGWSRLTRWLWGRSAQAALPPTYHVANWVFLRLLGLVLFFAFGSFLVQARGLIGSHGILPVSRYLEAAHAELGARAYHLLPTLFWAGASDPMLVGVAAAGVVLSLMVFAGWWPGLALLGAWGLYLSLCVAGQTFMGYQWDALLLETALLSAFLVPLTARRVFGENSWVQRASRWLLLFLLFRLMLESGAVKWLSGDPHWRDLTALGFHFETQPLPLPLAWWAHQMPQPALKAMTLGMFLVEFLAPFALLLPRRLRWFGFWGLVGLQAGIALTGNYTFFNLLTAALCLLMLDDLCWPERWRKAVGWRSRLRHAEDELREGDPARPLPERLPDACTRAGRVTPLFWAPVAFCSLAIGGKGLVEMVVPLVGNGTKVATPGALEWVEKQVAPLRSFNRYGLFAVMTTERREIVIEGSRDGVEWLPYEFRWKPGDVNRRPGLVAPFQPRLDWQMWFAALGPVEQSRWFYALVERLLAGEPEVLALLENNPFPDEPPRWIRAQRYRYHFTRRGEGDAWWRREPDGTFLPPAALR
ncbi:MAG TPA: lipase maturation factor family protein [Chthoniobacteraceae bacterium]|nr:lipase maturation factor family protein [Chthoniobacteraceae bacterium]